MRPPNTTQRTPARQQRRATSPGAFPTGRRTVDGALTRDDQVVAARVEADQVEDERRAGQQLRAERRERRAQAAGGARPG